MKAYLCARYGRQAEMREVAQFLEAHGHTVTSTWHDQDIPDCDNPDPMQAARWACTDIDEIDAGDTLIAFTENPDSPHGRGGRHVETGYALNAGKRLVRVGPCENIFHHLVSMGFGTMDGFRNWIEEGAQDGQF